MMFAQRLPTVLFIFIFTMFTAAFDVSGQQRRAFYINDFGAVGNGQTDNAIAIQKAIDACNREGGGKVIVPAGQVRSYLWFLSG